MKCIKMRMVSRTNFSKYWVDLLSPSMLIAKKYFGNMRTNLRLKRLVKPLLLFIMLMPVLWIALFTKQSLSSHFLMD